MLLVDCYVDSNSLNIHFVVLMDGKDVSNCLNINFMLWVVVYCDNSSLNINFMVWVDGSGDSKVSECTFYGVSGGLSW
jgi:hypothetical protein